MDCETGLDLSLGFGPTTGHHLQKEPVRPSLTLSLSDNAHGPVQRGSSPHSTLSSFSTATVKRQRDIVEEEVEVERVCSRTRDEDEDGNGRKKLRLTREQSALLEDRFKDHTTLNPKQKQALAKQLNLRPRQVEVWFQNRRARTKLKQTEVDFEFLKRCCETLSDENRRLQKEVNELRTMKLAQSPPLYMHLPAAAMTMCPSCERTAGVASSGWMKRSAAGAFVVGTQKRHFF